MKICVFGSSSDRLLPEYYAAARSLGQEIARRGHTLVFGGGARGLMGACAEGAHELGGEIIGIAPSYFNEPGILYENCTQMIYSDDINGRKSVMEEMSDAIVVMPGGIGTFEEFFEVLTARQLGRHFMPIALMNTLGYFDSLHALIVSCTESGFVSRSCLAEYTLSPTPADALREAEKPVERPENGDWLENYTK